MDHSGPMAIKISWRFAQYFSPDILHTRSMSLHTITPYQSTVPKMIS